MSVTHSQGPASGRSVGCDTGAVQPLRGSAPAQTRFHAARCRRNIRMSCPTTGRLGRVFSMLPATIALICVFASAAAAQEQRAPKWEFSGQYSFWHPGADIHGTLPLGLLPLTSRLEAN